LLLRMYPQILSQIWRKLVLFWVIIPEAL